MLNIGRAAAAVAYRTHEAELSSDATPHELISPVGNLQHTKHIDDDAGESQDRVDPIKRQNQRYQAPQKEKKPVTIAADIMSSPVFTLKDSSLNEVARKVFRDHR